MQTAVKVRMVAESAAPLVAAVLTAARVITPDISIAFIAVLLSVALLPGIAENFRKKRGWSQESTLMTTTSLFSLTLIYFVLTLTVSTITLFAESVLWGVLALQAFLYGGAYVHVRKHPRTRA